MHCPGGNAIDLIWRVLASSLGISSWTPLKPQHSNPNPNPFANQLWCIDFLTPPTPLIIPHRLPAFLESLMPLKMVEKQSEAFHTFLWHFSKFKTILLHIVLLKCPHVQIAFLKFTSCDFSRMYSNCCCSCSVEAEITKIGQSSDKMYSNNIVNLQESTTILNACTKKSGNLLKAPRIFLMSKVKSKSQISFFLIKIELCTCGKENI